jgi:hypothetical protein
MLCIQNRARIHYVPTTVAVVVVRFDHEKANHGHYVGLTDWLKSEIGQEGKDWEFVPFSREPNKLSHVCIYDPEKELLALLKWG